MITLLLSVRIQFEDIWSVCTFQDITQKYGIVDIMLIRQDKQRGD